MQSFIYNATIKGISVGLTFSLVEALSWVAHNPGGKVIKQSYRA